MTLEPKATLGHYRIVEKIGEGGMGIVYRAVDGKLEREVALKILRAEMASDPERMKRFEREARALAALTHPNIGAIYQIDEVDGHAFIVMELVEGITLRERIAGRPMPIDAMLDASMQIADALDAAHSKGIIHRDIKPTNILITPRGQVKMLDFGLAKLALTEEDTGEGSSRLETAHFENRHLTTPGTTMGTIAYMSPEQVRGEQLDARSDLFSCGSVLYEMVTGQGAFWANTSGLTFDAILNRTPPDPSEKNPGVPARLVEIIDRALEKDPRMRYQSAADLRADLARVRRDSESGRVAVTDPGRLPRGSRPGIRRARPRATRSWLVPAALALVLAAAAFIVFLRLPGFLTGGAAAIDSIAVLPFEYAGDRADGAYLSDGVTEGVINSLSKLPEIRVVPRSLVFPYKGRPLDPAQVAHELNVRGVVTGRVAQRGEDLTVTVELIDASNVAQIWGQQYARASSEILGMPEEITRDLSDALRVRLTPDQEERIARRYTENPDALAQYVKSLQQVRLGTPEEFSEAIAAAEKAIVVDLRGRGLVHPTGEPGSAATPGAPEETDPGFALAYAALARLYTQQAFLGFAQPGDAHTKARAAAEFALQMDESLAPAQAALSFVRFFYEWDWEAAARGFRRAIKLAPDDDEVRRNHAWYLMARGRVEEAVAEIGRAAQLNPSSAQLSAQRAEMLFWAKRDAEALAEIRKTLRLSPAAPEAPLLTACVLSREGRHADAIASYLDYLSLAEEESSMSPTLAYFYAVAGRRDEARRMLEETPPGQITPAQIGWIHAALGERDAAFMWLGKAVEQRSTNMTWILAQPWFDPLRRDPRFRELVARMGLSG